MRRILKRPVTPYGGLQEINAARVLSLGEQDRLMLWYEGTDDLCEVTEYAVIGTGWPIPSGFVHKQTVICHSGLAWHLMVRP